MTNGRLIAVRLICRGSNDGCNKKATTCLEDSVTLGRLRSRCNLKSDTSTVSTKNELLRPATLIGGLIVHSSSALFALIISIDLLPADGLARTGTRLSHTGMCRTNCMNSGYSRTSTDFLFFHRVRTKWLVQIQYIKHHTNLSRLNRDNQNAPVAIYVKTQISRYYKYEFPSLTLTIG